MLVTFRVLPGLLGALMLPQGLGMIREIFSRADMAKAFGPVPPQARPEPADAP